MHKYQTLVVLFLIAIAVVFAGTANAASWASFQDAYFSGIHLDTTLTSGMLHYELTLSEGATITIGSETYDVAWVGAFYVRTVLKDESFTALDAGTVKDWTWTQKPPNSSAVNLCGWEGQGMPERLFPDYTKTYKKDDFDLAAFDLQGVEVAPAFHLAYFLPDGTVISGFFVDPPLETPEPSGLQAGIGLLLGAASLRARKLKKAS